MLIALAFCSCKKDYRCTCQFGDASTGDYYRSAEVANYEVRKSKAKKNCEDEELKYQSKYAPFGSAQADSLVTCSIK